jgi:hypothetical protein
VPSRELRSTGLFPRTTLSNLPVMFSPIPVLHLVAFQF